MIFLDVGAHEGQTLEEVTNPRHGFHLIYAFEPMPLEYAILRDRFGTPYQNVNCLNYGLADFTGYAPLYGTNEHLEASLYPEKRDVNAAKETQCYFTRASEFFDTHISGRAKVIVKLNCEGAEVPILDDLSDSGELWKVANVMIDFDTRKVAGREAEADRILAKLDALGFDRYSLCEDVMTLPGASHQQHIAQWLDGLREAGIT